MKTRASSSSVRLFLCRGCCSVTWHQNGWGGGGGAGSYLVIRLYSPVLLFSKPFGSSFQLPLHSHSHHSRPNCPDTRFCIWLWCCHVVPQLKPISAGLAFSPRHGAHLGSLVPRLLAPVPQHGLLSVFREHEEVLFLSRPLRVYLLLCKVHTSCRAWLKSAS